MRKRMTRINNSTKPQFTVPINKHVLKLIEDRFNGNGHWFEEITIDGELKYDLNTLNYKKAGVYSYLRDKIED